MSRAKSPEQDVAFSEGLYRLGVQAHTELERACAARPSLSVYFPPGSELSVANPDTEADTPPKNVPDRELAVVITARKRPFSRCISKQPYNSRDADSTQLTDARTPVLQAIAGMIADSRQISGRCAGFRRCPAKAAGTMRVER
jgi:hypothetical protein